MKYTAFREFDLAGGGRSERGALTEKFEAQGSPEQMRELRLFWDFIRYVKVV
jgi:hypothetical protein